MTATVARLDAVGMAAQVAAVAEELAGIAVVPFSLAVGHVHDRRLGDRNFVSRTGVTMQVLTGVDFLAVEAALGLSRLADERETLVSSQGEFAGVFVHLFCGAERLDEVAARLGIEAGL